MFPPKKPKMFAMGGGVDWVYPRKGCAWPAQPKSAQIILQGKYPPPLEWGRSTKSLAGCRGGRGEAPDADASGTGGKSEECGEEDSLGEDHGKRGTD